MSGSPADVSLPRLGKSDSVVWKADARQTVNKGSYFKTMSDEPADLLLAPFAKSDSEGVGEADALLHGPEANASWLTAGQLMVADIVGVGVLSLPSAMSQLGWVMGPLFVILFFPLNLYTGLLLWRVKLVKPASITYMDMGKATHGETLSLFSAFVVYVHIWLTLGDYLLVLGESMGLIFHDLHLCKREWVFIGSLCIIPFSQLRYLNETRWLCWVNMGTITATIAVSLGYVIWLGADQTIIPGQGSEVIPEALDVFSFATAFSKIAFAYAGQFLYLEIMAEMRKPEDFPKSFFLAGPYQVFVYLFSGCVGYYYKGQNAKGLMINYVPFGGWLRCAATLLFVHMVITYLIKANVMSRAIHRKLSPERVNDTVSFRAKLEWFGVTTGVMISCIIVANAIPFFDSLTGLIGASFVPVACWNLPIIFFYFSRRDKAPISNFEWIALIGIFILGIVLTIVGTYSNMRDIVNDWGEYGAPFSCICDGIWNTCECSSSHTGMSEICNT